MITPYMNLTLPEVSETQGPDWAEEINTAFSGVDSHDHAAGQGRPIGPSGININADLTFNNYNITEPRTVRLYTNAAPLALGTDLGCLYRAAVDLYYNDGNGNQIQITSGGGVAGSPGNISNLVSPASASYVVGSKTFVWQQDVNKAAHMDCASIILRNTTTSSNGLTLSPPAAMGSNFTLTLPSLPASTKIMVCDSSGNMGATYGVDNSTIEVSSNNLQVKDLGITTAKLGDEAVTQAKRAALGQQTSSAFNQSTSSMTATPVPGASVTLTTTGRPVFIGGIKGFIELSLGQDAFGVVEIYRDGGSIASFTFGPSPVSADLYYPLNIFTIDVPSAASHTYQLYYFITNSLRVLRVDGQIMAYEL